MTPTNAQTRSSASTGVAVLPEPEQIAASSATTASADDLIAQYADKQIDALMGDDEGPPRPPLAEGETDPDDAIEAALQAASAVRSVADELAAPLALSATTVAEPEPAPAAPSFNPPGPAELERASAATTDTSNDALHSSAEAVARELAEDARLAAAPPPPQAPAVAAAEPVAAPALPAQPPLWRRLIGAILAIPAALIAAVNLPVSPLSDSGREVIGAIAIVTLVNAMALLAYLMLFS